MGRKELTGGGLGKHLPWDVRDGSLLEHPLFFLLAQQVKNLTSIIRMQVQSLA